MKIPKIMIKKVPYTYQSHYKNKLQTRIILLWWTLRVGRVIMLKLESTIRPVKHFRTLLLIIPEFKEGVKNV